MAVIDTEQRPPLSHRAAVGVSVNKGDGDAYHAIELRDEDHVPAFVTVRR